MIAKIKKIVDWFKTLNQIVRLHRMGHDWYTGIYIFRDGTHRTLEVRGEPMTMYRIPKPNVGLHSSDKFPLSQETPGFHLFDISEVSRRDGKTIAVYTEVEQ